MASVINGMTKAEAEKITWDGWLEMWKKQQKENFETYTENMKERNELRKKNPEKYFEQYVSNQADYAEVKEYIDEAKQMGEQLASKLKELEGKKTTMFYSKKKKKDHIDNTKIDIRETERYLREQEPILEAIKKREMEKDLTKHPMLAKGEDWIMNYCAKHTVGGDAVSPKWCMNVGRREGLDDDFHLPYEMGLVPGDASFGRGRGGRRRSRRRKRRKSRRGRKSRRKSKRRKSTKKKRRRRRR